MDVFSYSHNANPYKYHIKYLLLFPAFLVETFLHLKFHSENINNILFWWFIGRLPKLKFLPQMKVCETLKKFKNEKCLLTYLHGKKLLCDIWIPLGLLERLVTGSYHCTCLHWQLYLVLCDPPKIGLWPIRKFQLTVLEPLNDLPL